MRRARPLPATGCLGGVPTSLRTLQATALYLPRVARLGGLGDTRTSCRGGSPAPVPLPPGYRLPPGPLPCDLKLQIPASHKVAQASQPELPVPFGGWHSGLCQAPWYPFSSLIFLTALLGRQELGR